MFVSLSFPDELFYPLVYRWDITFNILYMENENYSILLEYKDVILFSLTWMIGPKVKSVESREAIAPGPTQIPYYIYFFVLFCFVFFVFFFFFNIFIFWYLLFICQILIKKNNNNVSNLIQVF